MDLTLEPLDPTARTIPRKGPRREPGTRVPPPIRLLPRDREEIARREARERRKRLLLNAAVGLVLVLLTALGIRYETRPGADRTGHAVIGTVPSAEVPR